MSCAGERRERIDAATVLHDCESNYLCRRVEKQARCP